jgi:hypothetical protein
MKIITIFLLIFIQNSFSLEIKAKNDYPYLLGSSDLHLLEKLTNEKVLDDESSTYYYIRLAEHYLHYGPDKVERNKGFELLRLAAEYTKELDVKLFFSIHVFSYKMKEYSDIANRFLIELSSLGYAPALEILLDGCEIELFKNCDIQLRSFTTRLLVAIDYENYNSNFICENYYRKNIEVENIALLEALEEMSLLKSKVGCTTKSGLKAIKSNFLKGRNVVNYSESLYVNSIIDYLQNKNQNIRYLEKRYYYKYSGMVGPEKK